MADEDNGQATAAEFEEMTVEQGLAMAQDLLARNDLAAVAALCSRILEFVPEHAAALNMLTIATFETRGLDEALGYARRAAAAAPADPAIQGNLGNLLLKKRDPDGAMEAYKRAVELGAKSPEVLNNLGVIVRARGEYLEAEKYFSGALALDPEHGAAHHNLSSILAGLGRTKEAIDHFWTGVLNTPPRSPYLTALAHNHFGRRDKAVEFFTELLKKDPNNAQVQHMLSSFGGADVPERASDAYIEMTFDKFATSFDTKLRRLAYQAPQLVAAAVATIVGTPRGDLAVLDAGCGTGLCGPLLRPYAKRLVGVDLSAGMLEKARDVGSYDDLVKAELTAFLDGVTEPYDLIVLADTLCYFGPLEAFAAAAAKSLKSGGALVFTVEGLPAEAAEGFRMDFSGRYKHAGPYVDQVLNDAGFEILARTTDTLRMESLDPVTGYVVSARRN